MSLKAHIVMWLLTKGHQPTSSLGQQNNTSCQVTVTVFATIPQPQQVLNKLPSPHTLYPQGNEVKFSNLRGNNLHYFHTPRAVPGVQLTAVKVRSLDHFSSYVVH